VHYSIYTGKFYGGLLRVPNSQLLGLGAHTSSLNISYTTKSAYRIGSNQPSRQHQIKLRRHYQRWLQRHPLLQLHHH
jgi:hypothetical protein